MQKANQPGTFIRYLKSIIKFKNENMKLIKHLMPVEPPPYVNLKIGRSYIQLEPLCRNNYNKGVYIHYGETAKNNRGKGIGTRLRRVAVNASKNTNIPLWQVSQNIEGLVKPGNMPISGKIMQKLGATEVHYAPPCRWANKRGPQNKVFVVGPLPHKRPIARHAGVTKTKRKLGPRTNN